MGGFIVKPLGFLFAGALLFSTPALAMPVTYLFESSAYNSFSYSNDGPSNGDYTLRGAYDPTDHLTIELTFESALPTGGTMSRGGPAIVSAYAFDGINTYDAHDIEVDLTTDASGAVTAWDIFAYRGGPDIDIFTSVGSQNAFGIVSSATEVRYEDEYALSDDYMLNVLCQGNQACFAQERLFPFAGEYASAAISRDRATWTVTPAIAAVPIGGTLPFMATGFLAFGAWRLRRKAVG
jgi:hypothetical protein